MSVSNKTEWNKQKNKKEIPFFLFFSIYFIYRKKNVHAWSEYNTKSFFFIISLSLTKTEFHVPWKKFRFFFFILLYFFFFFFCYCKIREAQLLSILSWRKINCSALFTHYASLNSFFSSYIHFLYILLIVCLLFSFVSNLFLLYLLYFFIQLYKFLLFFLCLPNPSVFNGTLSKMIVMRLSGQ